MVPQMEKPNSELSISETLPIALQLYKIGFPFFFIPTLAISIILQIVS